MKGLEIALESVVSEYDSLVGCIEEQTAHIACAIDEMSDFLGIIAKHNNDLAEDYCLQFDSIMHSVLLILEAAKLKAISVE